MINKNTKQIYRIYYYLYIIKYIQLLQATHPSIPTEAFAYDQVGNRTNTTVDAANKLLQYPNATYQYDPNGNITAITNNLDPTKNKTYAYDTLNRLNTANGPWGTIQYTYDSVGNRQTETTNTGVTNYTYTANKLTASTGEKTFSFNYDSNGNTIMENNRQYIYNQNQRLINAVENGVTTASYMYNGNGQRAGKATSAGTTIFHYDLNGNLIAESTLSGTITAEYVYLYGSPLAKIENNNIYYYHNDHLSTPQKMTDSNGSVVWYGEFKPFGEPVSITGTITNNLRFPGQYYDEETGNNYNYYRDYKPKIGRYIQKDPIGLRGGVNLYVYVGNSPMNFVDPLGLATIVIDPGHGDVYNKWLDSGAVANNEYEKDLSLSLSKAVGTELEKMGHTVIYTRTGDINVKQERLQWRIDISNEANADYFISIHLDSAADSNLNYFWVAYYSSKGKDFADSIASSIGQEGYSKCETKKKAYKVLTDTNAIAVLIEAGFITNAGNAKILSDSTFIKQLVKGIASGIK